jgi:hypothetical protein
LRLQEGGFRGPSLPKAAQPRPHSQVCDFFVSNIYVSRVDVADKETNAGGINKYASEKQAKWLKPPPLSIA